jgi:hypothetical protein
MSDILKFKKLVLANKKADKIKEKANKEKEDLSSLSKIILRRGYSLFSICFLQRDENEKAYHEPLFFLDKEDIEYLSNKYFPKLEKEMEAKIAEIKNQYEEE